MENKDELDSMVVDSIGIGSQRRCHHLDRIHGVGDGIEKPPRPLLGWSRSTGRREHLSGRPLM